MGESMSKIEPDINIINENDENFNLLDNDQANDSKDA